MILALKMECVALPGSSAVSLPTSGTLLEETLPKPPLLPLSSLQHGNTTWRTYRSMALTLPSLIIVLLDWLLPCHCTYRDLLMVSKDNVIVYRRLPGVCIACLFNLNLTAVWPNGLFFIPESLQSNH